MEERYKFRSRARKADESIDAYLTIFRELAKSCDFGDLEKEMIRDQIVEKCSSHILKQRLLQQGDLFLAKTVKIARNAETAVQEARLLSQGSKENTITVNHVRTSSRTPAKRSNCYSCSGTDGHSPSKCGALKSTCNNYKKVGHLQRVCRSKHETTRMKGKKWKGKKPQQMKVRSLSSNKPAN